MGVFLTLLVFVFPVIFIVGAMLGDAVGVGIFLGIVLLIVFLIFCSGIGFASGVTDYSTKSNSISDSGNCNKVDNSQENITVNYRDYNLAVARMKFGSSYCIGLWSLVFDFNENYVCVEETVGSKRKIWNVRFDRIYDVTFLDNQIKLYIYKTRNDDDAVFITMRVYKEEHRQEWDVVFKTLCFIIDNNEELYNYKTPKEKMKIIGILEYIQKRPII